MKRLFVVPILLFLLFFLHIGAFGQSDDITLMGDISPIFRLEKPFSKTVITSEDETLPVEVSDVVVEKYRILVRFFVTGLSEFWEAKITDDSRLYGSYLPVGEIVLQDGSILTPSSASRYSYLEYNEQRIIGGLLIFTTDQSPQAFYFNFNQIPFDTKPLSEGFTDAIVLHSASDNLLLSRNIPADLKNGLEFTLSAAAQTKSVTMLQPAVRMARQDEILSKFGWITITDSGTRQKYAVTRGNLYGFNLSDDNAYSPAHAYVFSPQPDETPLEISMDHAYVVRSFSPIRQFSLDLSGETENILKLDDELQLTITDIRLYPEKEQIRLYINSGRLQTADISFTFKDLNYVVNPSVHCGFDTENSSFACDIFFNEISFPQKSLTVEIDAVEYLLEGPWSFTWYPVPVEINTETEKESDLYSAYYPSYDDEILKQQPAEIQNLLDFHEDVNSAMMDGAGWIHESFELDYQFGKGHDPDLIPTDQFELYHTHYISEKWYEIDDADKVQSVITLVRNNDTNEIISAHWQRPGSTMDLLHALLAQTNQPVGTAFHCFEDFRNITNSSAVFLNTKNCSANDKAMMCVNFYQSLNGLPNSKDSQSITFQYDPKDGYIYTETILYGSDALKLTKTTQVLEKKENLPDDITTLMDSIK